jgi:hypothetical protein
MGSLSGLTLQMIEQYVADAETLLSKTTDMTAEEMKNAREAIDKANIEIARRNPFKTLYDAQQKYKEALKKGDANDAAKYFNQYNAAADSIKDIFNDFQGVFQGLGNVISRELGSVIEEISGIANSIGDAIKVFKNDSATAGDKIGAISGIISAATSAIGDFANALEEPGRSLRELHLYQERFYNAIFLNNMKLKDEDYDSVFGVNSIQRAMDAYQNMIDVQNRYQESLNKTTREQQTNDVSFDLWGKEIHKQNEQRRKALEKGYTEMQSMSLLVSESNWWQKLFGKGSRYTTLKDLAPELWGENGFDAEAAKIFLETNETINKSNNKAQKEAIENLIALKEAEEELMQVLDEQISNIFGSLSSDITNSLFDAIRNGTDAWKGFEDAGLKVIDALGKQLIQEMYIGAYLDTFRDRMRDAYSLGDMVKTQEELRKIMGDIYSGLGAAISGATEAAKQWDDNARSEGWDIDKLKNEGSGREAVAKGLAAMTQDTAEELNGRFTAMQYILTEMNGSMKMLQTNSAQALRHLAGIETNTARLEAIEGGIRSISAGVQDMTIKGVKLQ